MRFLITLLLCSGMFHVHATTTNEIEKQQRVPRVRYINPLVRYIPDTGLLNNIGNTKSSGVDRKSLDRSNERESSLLQRIRQNAGRTSPQKRDTQYAKDVNDGMPSRPATNLIE